MTSSEWTCENCQQPAELHICVQERLEDGTLEHGYACYDVCEACFYFKVEPQLMEQNRLRDEPEHGPD